MNVNQLLRKSATEIQLNM